jgi:hypothetical protein
LRSFQPPSQCRTEWLRLQWLDAGFRKKRNTRAEILSGSCTCYTTAVETGALTVAGQWRSFTAFPNILAIAMMSCAAARSSSSDVMETASMTSTFITGTAREVKVENLRRHNAESYLFYGRLSAHNQNL